MSGSRWYRSLLVLLVSLFASVTLLSGCASTRSSTSAQFAYAHPPHDGGPLNHGPGGRD